MSPEAPPPTPTPSTLMPPMDDFNAWADHYYNNWGTNCIPAPTMDKGKDVKDRKLTWTKGGWEDFQHRSMTAEEHEAFKRNGDYTSRKGIAIVSGRVWRGPNKGLWLTFADGDNQVGTDCLLKIFGYESLEQISKDFVVEQHKDAPNKVHIYLYSKVPLSNLTGLANRGNGKFAEEIKQNKMPGIEIKSERSGLAFSTPSFHVNGERYQIMEGGVVVPKRVLEEFEVLECETKIEDVFEEYGVPYLNNDGKIPMTTLLDSEFRIQQGNNRHNAVLRVGMHYLLKYDDRWEAEEKTKQWNLIHCEPPLSEDKYIDFPRTFEWSEKYVKRIKDKEAEEKRSEKDSKKEKAIKTATRLVEDQDIFWFHDEYQTAYARIKISNHYEIYRVFKKDRKFKLFLTKLYYDATGGSILKEDELKEIIRGLEAKGIFSGNVKKIHLRKSWEIKEIDDNTFQEKVNRDVIYYDMCTPNWTCIMVNGETESWELLPFHPENVTFYRYQQLPQVLPNRDYKKNILDDWLDMAHISNENDRLLFKVWVIALFVPEQPHPMLIPHGPPGATKSTFCKHLQLVFEPYAGEALILPTEKKELAQQAHHRAFLIYDNVEYDIPKWLSDLLCQLITSATVSKRVLYSDDDDFAYVLMRSVAINGLQTPKLKPDAMDRVIEIHFDRINEEDRRMQAEVDDWFRGKLPDILGKVFDTLAKSLRIYKTMEPLKRKPRMADFAVRGASIARALAELEGKDPDKMQQAFLDAYDDIMERQNIDVVEADSVASAIIRWHNDLLKTGKEGEDSKEYKEKGKIGYAPGDLLFKLTDRAAQMGFDVKDSDWPKKPNMFTKALRPLAADIKHGYNIDVHIFRDTKGEHTTKNSTWIEISEVAGNNNSSGAEKNSFEKTPPPPPPPPPNQNAGTISTQKGGDAGGDGGDSERGVSPPKAEQIEHENKAGGDGGDGGDTFDETIFSDSETAIAGRQAQQDVSKETISLVKYKSVSIDLEWDNRDNAHSRIFQFNFADCYGRSWVLNAERDFEGSESALIDAAIEELRNYDYVFSYYGKAVDRDWGVLDRRCKALGKISPVLMGKREDGGNSRIYLINNDGREVSDIDIGQLYEEPMIANFLGNIYPSNELDVVARAVLGKGKLVGVSGKDIVTMPLDLQIQYGLVDAQRTQELAMADNFLVLGIMDEIAKFVNMTLTQVCNSGPTTWWSNYYRNVMRIEPSPTSIKNTESYKGGDVQDINEDVEYRNVAVFDFKQQYPEIAKKYNLSFDTMCCDCCKNYESAKLHTGQPDIDAKGYWVCKQIRGAYPKALETLTAHRDMFKELYRVAEGNNNITAMHEYNVKQLAYKLFANAGYGVFGQPFFDYGDVRVAESITSIGRTKVNKLKEVIESDMFPHLKNVYRDTDSAFVVGIAGTAGGKISKDDIIVEMIEAEANKPEEEGGQLGIPLAYEKWYSKVLIHASKNYMGINGDTGKLVVRGLVGKKSNQCELVKSTFIQIRDHWKNDSDNATIEDYLKPIIESLDNKTVDIELLRERNKINQDPITGYLKTPWRPERVLGIKHGKRVHESVSFWHRVKKNDKDGYFFTENPAEIDFAYYKEPIRTAIKPILKVRGYDEAAINSLLRIPVPVKKEHKEKTTMASKRSAPSRGDADSSSTPKKRRRAKTETDIQQKTGTPETQKIGNNESETTRNGSR